MSQILSRIQACHKVIEVVEQRKSLEELMAFLIDKYDAHEVLVPADNFLVLESLQSQSGQAFDFTDIGAKLELVRRVEADFLQDFKMFEIPRNLKSRDLYEEASGTIYVTFDLKRDVFSVKNGLGFLHELILYRGIEEQDVRHENQLFHYYCVALSESGALDEYLHEEAQSQTLRTRKWLKIPR